MAGVEGGRGSGVCVYLGADVLASGQASGQVGPDTSWVDPSPRRRATGSNMAALPRAHHAHLGSGPWALMGRAPLALAASRPLCLLSPGFRPV